MSVCCTVVVKDTRDLSRQETICRSNEWPCRCSHPFPMQYKLDISLFSKQKYDWWDECDHYHHIRTVTQVVNTTSTASPKDTRKDTGRWRKNIDISVKTVTQGIDQQKEDVKKTKLFFYRRRCHIALPSNQNGSGGK